MKKIAIYNNKGGVGKTTSVINIAYSLNKKDNRVLVVDCDMQKNCYMFFLLDSSQKILPTKYENIKNTTYDKYISLSDDVIEQFNYIIFDLPPVLNDDVLDIIKKADKVYVPMMLRQFELSGLKNLVSKCNNIGGIFITMYEKRDEDILDQFKSALAGRLMRTIIPYSRAIIDSQRAMLPVNDYFIKRGVPAYLKNAWQICDSYDSLAAEIIRGNEP